MNLKHTTQCAKCPWRKDVNPHDIPDGYSVDKHKALKSTISSGLSSMAGQLRIMACHETGDTHCIGWLMHQLGPGNNIGLRLAMRKCENLGEVQLCGDQHQRFEDTLPEEE